MTLSADNIVQYSSHTNLLDVFTDYQTKSCSKNAHHRQLDPPDSMTEPRGVRKKGGEQQWEFLWCSLVINEMEGSAVSGPEPFSN